jgi:2-dehydro-3-deoxyphosphogluconate aldolase/(4S)-4-hydroxy-2-oxoglutarate aldolase
MPDKKLVSNRIVEQGILPLYFNADEAVSVEVLRAIFKAGIRAVEYTNRGEAALRNFKKLVEVKSNEMPDMFLGVGTIKTLQQAESYMDTGADFLVSPGLISEVVDFANSKNVFMPRVV